MKFDINSFLIKSLVLQILFLVLFPIPESSAQNLKAKSQRIIQTSNYIFKETRVEFDTELARLAELDESWLLSCSLQNTAPCLIINKNDYEIRNLGMLPLEGGWPRILDMIVLEKKYSLGGELIYADVLFSLSILESDGQFVTARTYRLYLNGGSDHKLLTNWFESPHVPEVAGTNHSWESGGGLALKRWNSENKEIEFYLGLGHFAAMTPTPERIAWYNSQDPSVKNIISSVVKIKGINDFTVLARGFRNVQGLEIVRTGLEELLVGTDMQPRGGDEINVIEYSEFYGWPYATFGTRYDKNDGFIPSSEQTHNIGKRPIFYFAEPGIAASPIIQIKDKVFIGGWLHESFENLATLIVGRMANGSLSVLGFNGERILFEEVIDINGRPRSIVESSGKIYVGSEEKFLIILEPIQVFKNGEFQYLPNKEGELLIKNEKDAMNEPSAAIVKGNIEEGERVFRKCIGCHSLSLEGKDRAGPHLVGIIGRNIASVENFDYSEVFRSKNNQVWTKELLDKFLTGPTTEIPGTLMVFPGISISQERADLIEFLKSKTN